MGGQDAQGIESWTSSQEGSNGTGRKNYWRVDEGDEQHLYEDEGGWEAGGRESLTMVDDKDGRVATGMAEMKKR